MQGSGPWSWGGWASVSTQGWPRAVLAKMSPLGDRQFLNVFLVFDLLIAYVRVAWTSSCLSCNAGQKLVYDFHPPSPPRHVSQTLYTNRDSPGQQFGHFSIFPPSSFPPPSGCFPASSLCYPKAFSTEAEPPSQDPPLQHILLLLGAGGRKKQH